MTAGLLVSRRTKLELCKKASKERTPESVQQYKTYRNLFNTVMRASEKHYFSKNLFESPKNPKKTWQ